MPLGEFLVSAGSAAKKTTVTPPRAATMTAKRTCAEVELVPIRLAEYTAPMPSWPPTCAPFRSETCATSCHCAVGRADTVDWSTEVRGWPPWVPTTVTRPSLVPSEIPFASWLRTVHPEL